MELSSFSSIAGLLLLWVIAGLLLLFQFRHRRKNQHLIEKQYTEETEALLGELKVKEPDCCVFWFASRRHILESTDKSLPSFQELKARNGFLHQHTITRTGAFKATYTSSFLAVSHRWLGVGKSSPPDEDGTQLEAIRAFLCDNPAVQWVWFDYWCMPQGQRSAAENAEFKHMLTHANLLYLGCSVLILLDLSYVSRFWTQFECWLSMQEATPDGLKSAARDESRCKIRTIYGANSMMIESLYAMWASRNPQEAYSMLAKPDVTVTNASDKEEQLKKLGKLNGEVQAALKEGGGRLDA